LSIEEWKIAKNTLGGLDFSRDFGKAKFSSERTFLRFFVLRFLEDFEIKDSEKRA